MSAKQAKPESILTTQKPSQDALPVLTQSTVDEAEIDAIVSGYHGAPFSVLGPHEIEVEGKPALAIRAFRPLDSAVFVVTVADGDKLGERRPMEQVDDGGFFEAILPPQSQEFRYRLIAVDHDGHEFELEDPYRFPPTLTDYDLYLFGEGNFFFAYEKFGAHLLTIDGVAGVNFVVWAPNAKRVSVVGPFNGWDERTHPMRRRQQSGVWELFFPNLPAGMHYKYAILSTVNGYEVNKSDPFGFYAELRPSTDSRVWNLYRYVWQDKDG